MRNNAMDHQAHDPNNDPKPPFNEFSALVRERAKKIEAKRKERAEKEGLDPAEVEASSGRVVGAINLESPVAAIVRSSMTEASQLCEATYLTSPPVAVVLAWDALPFTEDVRDTTNAIYENVSAWLVIYIPMGV